MTYDYVTNNSILHEENFSDETDQPFDQGSSLRTRARRRYRLYRLSTEVRRWSLADGFNMDDPAYGVSLADLSWIAIRAVERGRIPPASNNAQLGRTRCRLSGSTSAAPRRRNCGKPSATSSMTQ